MTAKRGFGHFLAGCGMEEYCSGCWFAHSPMPVMSCVPVILSNPQEEPKCFDEYCGLRVLFSKEDGSLVNLPTNHHLKALNGLAWRMVCRSRKRR